MVGFAELPIEERIWLVIIAGTLLLLNYLVGWLRSRSRAHANAEHIREAANLLVTVTDAVIPTLRHLGIEVSRPSNLRPRAFQDVVKDVLFAFVLLFPDTENIRVVVYRYSGAHGRRKRRLEVEDWRGRRKDQPEDFVDGDGGRGEAVFKWLEAGTLKFVPDTREEPDQDWKGSGRGYLTYISAPIRADGTLYGMLTVDAPKPGDLDETDSPMVEMLAGILAVAFAAQHR